MSVLHDVASFVRWRIIAVRYAGKVRGVLNGRAFARTTPRTELAQRVENIGYESGPKLEPEALARIIEIYRPRVDSAERHEGGAPFVNLFAPEDIDPGNPLFQLAFSAQVLDIADDYFGGRLSLDSIQVLYSWPTHGQDLRASQMWHKDYGDSRSFHYIAYLNDVNGPEDGPFSFIDKRDTRRIMPSAHIRRISDSKFSKELGEGRLREFLGSAGDSIYVDPAACYHSGSRCKNSRLAIFVTFNTSNSYVAPTSLVRENRQRILNAAKAVRPDLSELYLRRLLSIQ
jgi:hypothetical protein